MGNALNDIGDNFEFQLINKMVHPLFNQIDVLQSSIQDYPDIEQYMRVNTKLSNEEYINFMKRYIKLQNLYKHEQISPFLIYIKGNIFEYPNHSLYDEIQIRKQRGTLFAESELWYLAKCLIQGYSAYLSIPELVRASQLTLQNIFITKQGQIKVSLHVIYLTNALTFKNQYIEESQVSHKITKEIGLVLLDASCLSFEDSIKMLEIQYSQEYANFVKDMIQDVKAIQYFQNYQMSKKISKTIYADVTIKQTKPLPQQESARSMQQSQIIETYNIKSPAKTEPNQFDQVSKIASIPEANLEHEQEPLKSQQIDLFSGRKSTQPMKQSEIFQYHSRQQSLQIDYQPQIFQASKQSFPMLLDPLSDSFNQRFWKIIGQSKRQILIQQQRSKQIY